jgi:hypothetical protein
VIGSNALRVAAINSVGDFVLFLGKVKVLKINFFYEIKKKTLISGCCGFGDHAGGHRADSEQRRRAARVGAHRARLTLCLLGGALVHDHLRGIHYFAFIYYDIV